MSDEMVGTAQDAPASSVETPGTDAQVAASSPDPSDFDSKLRNDPDFAVRFAKEQQSEATRAKQRLKQADLALQIAERLGNGDVAAGSAKALEELALFAQIKQNPTFARMLERFQSGAPLETQPSYDGGGSLYDAGTPSEDDPREKQLRALQGNVARLEESLSVRSAVDAFKSFQNTEYGRLLNKEEMGEVFSGMEAQIKAWSKTPEGRNKLMSLTPEDVNVIALNHLHRTNKLLELGERRAQQRSAQLRERETDVPSRISADRVPRTNGAGLTALEAFKQAKSELGLA